jgi:cytochrome P450
MDEIVRWVSPASANARHVKQDTEVRGCPMQAGDPVLVMWGSANHDEREFPNAESLVIDRFPNRHVGFGMGPHRCVGSHLAKLIMTAYFQRILPELDNFRLDGEDAVRWGGAETRGIRGLKLARI